MFKKGDRYIHFTKYGGINIGEVDKVLEVTYNSGLACYVIYYIKSRKGFTICIDGTDGRVYKVTKINEKSISDDSR